MNTQDIFKIYYKEEKEELEKELNIFNTQLLEEENPIIKENLSYFKELNTNGKLVRGLLVKLGYSLLKEDSSYSNQLALAYEIFQTAILVHDDIIDKDEKRREKPTIHYLNGKKYKEDGWEESTHLGNSIAICMGDYGLYLSNKVISDSYYEDKNLGKILSYFNDIVLKTIKGEILDVILPFQSKKNNLSKEEIEKSINEIYRLKTAYYTIIGPMVCGLILAGGDLEKQKDLTRFGEKIGIAFQIQDDLLGIYSEEIGKVVGSDIREFKQTILFSHVIGTSYKEEFLKIYGKESLSTEIVEKVKDILEKSGSKKYAEKKMNEMYDEGLDILKSITWIEKEKKQLLAGFVEYLRGRNK